MTLMPKTALVIGATGGVGGAVTHAVTMHGWRVKALNRNPEHAAAEHPILGVEWIKGNAMTAADVVASAKGVQLIVHAANPLGYKGWDKLISPMMENSIAAKVNGARISFRATSINTGGTPASSLRRFRPNTLRAVKEN